ncbi:MAG: DNA cytosine methyltransferase [Verrucomicrobiaceae bacterium]|nr:MAG: DNA cytosine methyltransferase [Verrucomicrobiaceae bacterium]
MKFTALELCAGGGGQALGLEMAGFQHAAAVEYESQFCETLRANRPKWNVINKDIRDLNPSDFTGLDLLAGGVPCPPFSIAGKQLGGDDERDMFPTAMALIKEAKPRAVLLENVQGLASAKFSEYRKGLETQLFKLGYVPEWRVLQASDFGVPQLRPRFVLVGLRKDDAERFMWPIPNHRRNLVGETLVDLMGSNGWSGAELWAAKANAIAPTIVGGSKKHGGPDLGPTRAKRQWLDLSVDGMGIANESPASSFPLHGIPRLTVRMVARIQGFPDSWKIEGKKTVAYRQVGNAFPPPVAEAIGKAIIAAFTRKTPYASEPHAYEARLLEEPTKSKRCLPKKVQKR